MGALSVKQESEPAASQLHANPRASPSVVATMIIAKAVFAKYDKVIISLSSSLRRSTHRVCRYLYNVLCLVSVTLLWSILELYHHMAEDADIQTHSSV